MNPLIIAIAVLVIIIAVYKLVFDTPNNMEKVTYGGFQYGVDKLRPTKSAQLLDRMNATAIELIRLMRKRIEQHDDGTRKMDLGDINKLRDMYQKLRMRYNPDKLQETIKDGNNPELTSYTVDKGQLLSMCVRYNGEYEPWPVLLLVLLHELTHMAVDVHDHPAEFWDSYRFILRLVASEGWAKDFTLPSQGKLYCGQVYIGPNELAKLKHLYVNEDANTEINSP